MAYSVYMGTIKKHVSPSGNQADSDDDAIVDWAAKRVIFDGASSEHTLIIDPVLTQEHKQIGTFTFTVPKILLDPMTPTGSKTNPIYENFQIDTTIIAIYQDGKTLYWIGTVTGVTLNFDLSKSITVRGVDEHHTRFTVRVLPLKYYITFRSVIDSYDSLLDYVTADLSVVYPYYDNDGLKLTSFGTKTDIQIDQTIDLTKDGTSLYVSWDAINNYFFDQYGGYWYYTYSEGSSGAITIIRHYMSDITDKTDQTVEYGQNMLDLEIEETKPDDFVNYVYTSKTVSTTSGWWIFTSSSTNWISGYAEDAESIKKYGRHTRIIVVDNATTSAQLNDACKKELAKYKQEIEPTISVKAFDLADTGSATDHLGYMKKTRIISKPHGIDEWMVCTKEVLPLDKPDQKEFTFGRPVEKLTKQQSKNSADSQQAKLTLKGLVSHAQG